MSLIINKAFKDLADLRIWFNDKSGIPLTLADVSEIIPLRWIYFRENWEFILDSLTAELKTYEYPDLLDSQIKTLSQLIRVQRNDASRQTNPFSKVNILNTYYAVWSNVLLSSIPLTKGESNIINDKVARIRRFIKTDFINIRASLAAGRDEISDTVGLSDTDYRVVLNIQKIFLV